MKKILLILTIFVFLLAFSEKVVSQDEGIKISLIEYNSETNSARIQIENTLDTDLHNVYFQLDKFPSRLMTPTFVARAATARAVGVPEGIHKVTITSDELTVSKELSFSASAAEKLKEFEDTQRERKREITRDLALEAELTKNAPVIEKESSPKLVIIIIIGLLVIAIVAYIIFSRKKE